MMLNVDLTSLTASLGDKRVIPALLTGQKPDVPRGEQRTRRTKRDDSASWTGFLQYVDAEGRPSARRFTFRSLIWNNRVTHALGYCHERRAARTLFVDSIVELMCVETGEVLDPRAHIEQLRLSGALGAGDADLDDLGRIPTFLARCDGDYHALEQAALTAAIERYCLRCDGSDAMIEAAIKGCGRLAPDASDMVRSIRRLSRSANGSKVARLALDAGAAIIDADGRHAPEEVEWAVELSGALKQLCDRGAR